MSNFKSCCKKLKVNNFVTKNMATVKEKFSADRGPDRGLNCEEN